MLPFNWMHMKKCEYACYVYTRVIKSRIDKLNKRLNERQQDTHVESAAVNDCANLILYLKRPN